MYKRNFFKLFSFLISLFIKPKQIISKDLWEDIINNTDFTCWISLINIYKIRNTEYDLLTKEFKLWDKASSEALDNFENSL